MDRFPSLKLYAHPWLLVALAGALHAAGCGGSTKENPGGGKGGSAGIGGAAGKGGKAGSGGRAGASGGGGRAGSTGKGGSGGSGESGNGGDAGEPGGGGRAGGPQGGSAGTGAGQAGEGGEAGATTALEGTTCRSILAESASAPSGVYTIDPDGAGGDPPVDVVCDMTTDGGGWTLGLIKNSLHNGRYEDFASGRVEPSALATTPEAASATTGAMAVAGWLDLNEFPYTDLELAGYRDGMVTYRSEPIPKSALRIPFGTDGYYLYDQVDGYYWCGGSNAFTTNGVGQVMKPTGAPDDCKGHTSLGDGWDFGASGYNTALTVCGGGSGLMTTHPMSSYVNYGSPGAAQAFWVR